MLHHLFLASSLFLFPVLGYCDSNSYPVQWTTEIKLQSLNDIPEQLASPNTGKVNYVNQNEHVVAKSCQDYFKYTKLEFSTENNAEIAAESYFIKQCLPLHYLQQAKPAKISYLRHFDLQKDFGLLPAALVMPGISGNDPVGSLKTAYPDVELLKDSHAKTTVPLQSKRANLIAIISILAWGDFNQDGYDDLLLFVANYPYSWQGTYHTYHVYMVTQKTKDDAIKAISG